MKIRKYNRKKMTSLPKKMEILQEIKCMTMNARNDRQEKEEWKTIPESDNMLINKRLKGVVGKS